ncbi:hypothetical protein L1987_63308 [Smallanthus sonchifolius]|uniref:Uncharacterized protein n=1 Tax=Smallanthus sonchifolius TaxID=185202 RepID=A0ACB9CCY6_9ASTR|nr:hypothetical protein L1987_63308 [Smallanthus sonchifolius]
MEDWRFISNQNFLWVKIVNSIHGTAGISNRISQILILKELETPSQSTSDVDKEKSMNSDKEPFEFSPYHEAI